MKVNAKRNIFPWKPSEICSESVGLRSINGKKEQSRAFRNQKVGTIAEVLFEEPKVINGENYQIGHTAEYVKVAKKETKDLSNFLITGKITGFLEDDILFME